MLSNRYSPGCTCCPTDDDEEPDPDYDGPCVYCSDPIISTSPEDDIWTLTIEGMEDDPATFVGDCSAAANGIDLCDLANGEYTLYFDSTSSVGEGCSSYTYRTAPGVEPHAVLHINPHVGGVGGGADFTVAYESVLCSFFGSVMNYPDCEWLPYEPALHRCLYEAVTFTLSRG